jgi:hypothetical protein
VQAAAFDACWSSIAARGAEDDADFLSVGKVLRLLGYNHSQIRPIRNPEALPSGGNGYNGAALPYVNPLGVGDSRC